MKSKTAVMMMTLILGLGSVTVTFAQEGDQPPRRDRPGRPERPQPPGGADQRGPGREGFRPPIMAALDANGDGVIDAREIENASAALKKLDKNGDGKITPEEYRPPGRPGGPGPGGPGGPGFGERPRRPDGPPPGDQGTNEPDRPRPPRPPSE